MITNAKSLDDLSRIIADYLAKGIRLTNDMVSFAGSALSADTTEALKSLLSDPSEYGDGLIELVFSPDDMLKIAVEPSVPGDGMTDDDLSLLINRITTKTRDVVIRHVDGTELIRRIVTPTLIRPLVRRLHLGKAVGPLMTAEGLDAESRDFIIRVRVIIRSMDFYTTEKREHFLRDCIRILPNVSGIDEGDVLGCIEFMLRLFREVEEDFDIYSLIEGKVRLYRGILEKKKIFEECLRTQSIEYLMSQRIYDPPESIESIHNEMKYAGIINRYLFERTE